MAGASVFRALVVCTGNTCRSPMGEAILRARLHDAGIPAEVRSAGTLGWNRRPATPHAVTVMAELGFDIGGHTSTRLGPDLLHGVDVIVTMTRDHAGAVIARDPGLRPRVFLPAEFARLANGSGPAEESGPTGSTWAERVAAVGARRDGTLVGRPAEEVADPVGEPIAVYRATAARLERELGRLVAALPV